MRRMRPANAGTADGVRTFLLLPNQAQKMKDQTSVPFRHSLAALSAALLSTSLFSQTLVNETEHAESPVVLNTFVVSTTRTPHDPAGIPGSVTLLTPAEWERSQTPALVDLFRSLPGVAAVSTGAAGAQTSLFFRGSAPHQTLFLVDGVRVNDRGAFYQNFLGGADLANLGRVEVLRGPQSVLYGGSAMGGVISIETLRGSGDPTLRLDAEAGSFETLSGSAALSGSSGVLGYSASASRFETANDRPENDFDSTEFSARLDWEDSNYPGLEFGATVRGMESTYDEPGSRGPFPFTGVLDFEQLLATAFAKYETGPMRARLILAHQDREYSFTSIYGSTPVESRRRVVDFQVTLDAGDSLEVTGGVNFEPSRQETPGELKKEKLRAGFVSAVWDASESTSVVLGARHDDFDSVGGHTTWRAGVSHTVISSGTILRAMAGTAFTAPSLDDRYGNLAFFQPASPDIQPERSKGWEAGIEQPLAGGRGRVTATWFSNRYRNLFGFDPDTFATINVGRASSTGVELAGEFTPCENVRVLAGYTWTDAEDSSNGSQLPRRPSHSANIDTTWEATTALTLGAGVRWVADRVDVGAVDLPDYATVRVHASWQATPRVRAHVRVENLFNRDYEEVAGYPALGIGAFGGLTISF
jgi:vitamin B12 transporter